MIRYTPAAHLVLTVLIPTLFTSPSMADSEVQAYYTGEVLSNSGGGLKDGSAYLSDAGLTVSSDLSGLFGESEANVFAYFLWNNSNTFSDRYVGDLQTVSNIDAIRALRVYELWYEEALNDDVSVRFGLYDLNSEFDAIETAALFVNSSHGIGAEYGQTGQNGPSIFPVTSLAARFELAIDERNILRYALLDGVPGDPSDPRKTSIDLGDGDGILHALEYNHETGGGARFAVGGWLYSADFDRIEPNGSLTRGDGNGGIYVFVDTPIFSSAESDVGTAAFLRYGIANDEFNALDSYLGAGATATGIFPSRPEDQIGIAVAHARIGDSLRRFPGADVQSYETTIELTYSAQVTDWLRLQPDIQFVINPGADPALENALVLGLRFELTSAFPTISHEWR